MPPTTALITISRPDGTPLGTFRADAEDTGALAATALRLSDDQYGPLHASDLEALIPPSAGP